MEDLKHGKGIFYWQNGARQLGYWVQGKMHGKGLLFYKERKEYNEWELGKKLTVQLGKDELELALRDFEKEYCEKEFKEQFEEHVLREQGSLQIAELEGTENQNGIEHQPITEEDQQHLKDLTKEELENIVRRDLVNEKG